MGDISKKLHRKLASKADNLPIKVPKRRPGEPLPGGIRDIEMLIKDGHDPVHAAYAYIQQISSHFAEGVSQLPEMKLFAKLAGDAEEEYMTGCSFLNGHCSKLTAPMIVTGSTDC